MNGLPPVRVTSISRRGEYTAFLPGGLRATGTAGGSRTCWQSCSPCTDVRSLLPLGPENGGGGCVGGNRPALGVGITCSASVTPDTAANPGATPHTGPSAPIPPSHQKSTTCACTSDSGCLSTASTSPDSTSPPPTCSSTTWSTPAASTSASRSDYPTVPRYGRSTPRPCDGPPPMMPSSPLLAVHRGPAVMPARRRWLSTRTAQAKSRMVAGATAQALRRIQRRLPAGSRQGPRLWCGVRPRRSSPGVRMREIPPQRHPARSRGHSDP